MHATTQKPDIDMCQGSVCCGEGTYLASSGLCLSKIKCGPGTKLDIDAGECIPTMEGLMEACFESRPGWEYTCQLNFGRKESCPESST